MVRKLVLRLSLLLAVCSPWLGAEPVWVNGQAARMAIGQPSFTRQNPVSSRETIGGAAGIAIAADRLFIADDNQMGSTPNNNRVLIYESLSSFIPAVDGELPQGDDQLCPVCVGLPDVVLGQTDFDSFNPSLSEGLQTPTAVHSDGIRLAVSDTNNNRVLIWNTIPTMNGTPPDVVIGQPDFTTNTPDTSATGLRGPNGVWIDSGRLFIADTQNGRVLIYNSIPTSNGASANVVLGQPDFDTRPEPDLTQSNVQPTATGMLDPVSVSVSNGRLLVADLGFNRVVVFSTVPTQNAAAADVVMGQPDFESSRANNSQALCDPLPQEEGDDGEDNDPVFPRRCDATLSFPRFALSDGQRLFIADSGNDRVLIYDEVPMANGARPNTVLGQPDFSVIEESDGAASLRAPSSLAFDGLNLYVADPFARRVLVFTPGEDQIVQDGLVNGASFAVLATGTVTWDGELDAGSEHTVSIGERDYTFTAEEGDDAMDLRDSLLEQITNDPDAEATARPIFGTGEHATGRVKFGGQTQAGDVVTLRVGNQEYQVTVTAEDTVTGMVDIFSFFIERRPDPNVVSDRDPADADTLLLTARDVGRSGNSIAYSVTLSPGATLTAELEDSNLTGGNTPFGLRLMAKVPGDAGDFIALDTTTTGDSIQAGARSGGTLTGGSDARELPAGSIASLFGTDLSVGSFEADPGAERLPTELGGVRVYVNGMLAPLYSVSPEQINFQVPYEAQGTSISVYVWRRSEDTGEITVSAPRAARVARASPGLFAFAGLEPRRGIAVHAAGAARGTVALAATAGQSTVNPGTVLTITVNGRDYSYTTVDGDSPESVRDRLVDAINTGDGDPEVTATAGVEGFFSARADVVLSGEIQANDVVNIIIRGRVYSVQVQEDDSLVSVRNKLVFEINSGLGDPEVTARRLAGFFEPTLQVVARSLGTEGNDIPFEVSVSDNATIVAETNVEEGVLQGGQTPPVVTLTARESGRQGNDIQYSASSSDTAQFNATARGRSLCCGNVPFSLIDDENPAIPGETIVLFGSGLGLTAPLPEAEGFGSGERTPLDPLFTVPAVSDDFVASLAGGRTAVVEFVGLMPGFVGVYQINLRLNGELPDNPDTPLTIFQVFFISNTITIPVKNLRPRNDLF